MQLQVRRLTSAIVVVPFMLLAVACSDSEGASSPGGVVPRMTVADATPTTSATPTASAAAITTTSAPSTSSTTVAPTTTAPAFVSRIGDIDGATAVRMRSSWRVGCPVALADLRYVTVSHWGYDGVPHAGELVVSAAHAEAIVTAFAALFAARFPIERMRLVDDYGGDDKASMRANNTSAFNCREVDGRPGVLSAHSWGTAIDINPLVNPWVRGDLVDPPEGAPYADRTQRIVGGIFAGDAVVQAFAAIGWAWGGAWPTSKDLQHFSAGGN